MGREPAWARAESVPSHTLPYALPQVADDLSMPEEFYTPKASPSQQSTGEFGVSAEGSEKRLWSPVDVGRAVRMQRKKG